MAKVTDKETERNLELERLDELHNVAWPMAMAGDLAAMDAVLAIMERRAALLGLDAPRRFCQVDRGEGDPGEALVHAAMVESQH